MHGGLGHQCLFLALAVGLAGLLLALPWERAFAQTPTPPPAELIEVTLTTSEGSNTFVLVNGKRCLVPCRETIRANTSLEFSIPKTQLHPLKLGVRFAFDHWVQDDKQLAEGDKPDQKVTSREKTTYKAVLNTQYLLKIEDPVGGCRTEPSGQDGFYGENTEVRITCQSTVLIGEDTKKVLTATPLSPVKMNKITTVPDPYGKTQYKLTIERGGEGRCRADPSSPEGFYDLGTTVKITCDPSVLQSQESRLVLKTPPPLLIDMTGAPRVAPYKTQYKLVVDAASDRYTPIPESTDGFYDKDQEVTLEPVKSAAWEFLKWSGDCKLEGNRCTVKMNAAKAIGSKFRNVSEQEVIAGLKVGLDDKLGGINSQIGQANAGLQQMAGKLGSFVWVFGGVSLGYGLLAIALLFMLRRAFRRPPAVPVTLQGAQSLIDSLRSRGPVEVSFSQPTLDTIGRQSQGQAGGPHQVRVQAELAMPADLSSAFKVLLSPTMVQQAEKQIKEVNDELGELKKRRVIVAGEVERLDDRLKTLSETVSGLVSREVELKPAIVRAEKDLSVAIDSATSFANQAEHYEKEYRQARETARTAKPPGPDGVPWNDGEERLREQLIKLNSERPQRLLRLFVKPSSADQLMAWKSATEGTVFENRGYLAVPIADGVHRKAVVRILIDQGITEATAHTVVQEGLDLDETEEKRYQDLLHSSQHAWTHERTYPPVFMAPFWYISLQNIYKWICQAKHMLHGREFPNSPSLDYTTEEGFKLLLDEYLQPFVEEVAAQGIWYQGGRSHYPTDQRLLTTLNEAMEEQTGKVISRQLTIEEVHRMVETLNETVRDQNLKDYSGFTRLRARWSELRDVGARQRWATVCAALDPYFKEFLLHP